MRGLYSNIHNRYNTIYNIVLKSSPESIIFIEKYKTITESGHPLSLGFV